MTGWVATCRVSCQWLNQNEQIKYTHVCKRKVHGEQSSRCFNDTFKIINTSTFSVDQYKTVNNMPDDGLLESNIQGKKYARQSRDCKNIGRPDEILQGAQHHDTIDNGVIIKRELCRKASSFTNNRKGVELQTRTFPKEHNTRENLNLYPFKSVSEVISAGQGGVLKNLFPNPRTKFGISKEKETTNYKASYSNVNLSMGNSLLKDLKYGMPESTISAHGIEEKKLDKAHTLLTLKHHEDKNQELKTSVMTKDTALYQQCEEITATIHRTESSMDPHRQEVQESFHEIPKKSTIYNKTRSSRKLRSDRIHIIGMGPVGQCIAHKISQLYHAPPIILLMHRPLMMQQWHDEGAAIQILRDNKISIQTGFHIESSAHFQRISPYQRFVGFGPNLEHTAEPPNYTIDNLIVTTSSCLTISALQSIQHRIKSTTTVCIIQNGMGIVQKLNKVFFTDEDQRPTYVLGHLVHKLRATGNLFTHIEKGPYEFYCSKLPRYSSNMLEVGASIERTDFSWSPEARHLVSTLLRIPELNTETLGHRDFYKRKLSDLVVYSVIEPLAVAFDCANSQLLYNFSVSNFMKKLLQELSLIITSLPELQTIKNLKKHFNPESLEKKIIGHLKNSENMVSEMQVNLRAGKRTEIDFYTGYFVERAYELEIPCPVNEMVYNLVKGKQTMKRREENKIIPFL